MGINHQMIKAFVVVVADEYGLWPSELEVEAT